MTGHAVRLGPVAALIALLVFAPPSSLGTGVFEGAVASPRNWATFIDGLLASLRAAGGELGLRVFGEWLGALMLMDDLLLLAESHEELLQQWALVLRWCWVPG